jgi:hypothetical protein
MRRDVNIVSNIWPMLKPFRGMLVILVAIGVLASLLEGAGVALFALAFDALQKNYYPKCAT